MKIQNFLKVQLFVYFYLFHYFSLETTLLRAAGHLENIPSCFSESTSLLPPGLSMACKSNQAHQHLKTSEIDFKIENEQKMRNLVNVPSTSTSMPSGRKLDNIKVTKNKNIFFKKVFQDEIFTAFTL